MKNGTRASQKAKKVPKAVKNSAGSKLHHGKWARSKPKGKKVPKTKEKWDKSQPKGKKSPKTREK